MVNTHETVASTGLGNSHDVSEESVTRDLRVDNALDTSQARTAPTGDAFFRFPLLQIQTGPTRAATVIIIMIIMIAGDAPASLGPRAGLSPTLVTKCPVPAPPGPCVQVAAAGQDGACFSFILSMGQLPPASALVQPWQPGLHHDLITG